MYSLKTIDTSAELLSSVSEPVRKGTDLREEIAELKRLMTLWGGIGFAAPQAGLLQRFFVMKPKKKFRVCINPTIIHRSGTTIGYEGCLSIRRTECPIERSKVISVRYYNQDWKLVTKTLKGIEAICFQHELDHLDGILITERDIR